MDKEFDGKAPGLLYAASKVTKPDVLPIDDYITWYGEEHIQDVFETANGSVEEAYIWEALDRSVERPVLVTYPLKDTEFLRAERIAKVPTQYDSLPGSGELAELASFDVRSYTATQLFVPKKDARPGQSDFLVSAAFTPVDDEEYDAWYRQEHLFDVAKAVPGWRRTERYELIPSKALREATIDSGAAEPPKFLTLHYIDGEDFPAAEMSRLTESDWTQDMMSTMKQSEILIFGKTAHHTR